MALWGTKDVVYGQNTDGSVAISGVTVTGTGTTFNTANLIKAGDITVSYTHLTQPTKRIV